MARSLLLTRIKDPKGINIFPAAWADASIAQAKHRDDICASVRSLALTARVPPAASYAAWLLRLKELGSTHQGYKSIILTLGRGVGGGKDIVFSLLSNNLHFLFFFR